MNNKIILSGLKAEDYLHPKDYAFVHGDAEDSSLVSKGLSLLSNASIVFLRRITEGRYVEITEKANPYLIGVLKNTCAILDVPYMPRLFVRHERCTSTTVGGEGANAAQILMPDYILQEYDEDMLYYVLGNAVAMLKAGHVKLSTVCSVMVDTPVTKPFQLALEACMRAADLSSDRGGLLACQSYSAAARCVMSEAGMPPREMRGMNDEEIEAAAEAFMIGADDVCPNWMTTLAGMWKKLNWSTTPPVERLRELKAWYDNGYDALMRRWERGTSL